MDKQTSVEVGESPVGFPVEFLDWVKDVGSDALMRRLKAVEVEEAAIELVNDLLYLGELRGAGGASLAKVLGDEWLVGEMRELLGRIMEDTLALGGSLPGHGCVYDRRKRH